LQESKNYKFLIDGFPRNEDNLAGWTQAMSDKVNLLFVLFFDCSEQKCTERCLKRGQAGSGRSDDNMDSLKKRFDTYCTSTMPIIEHYRRLDLVKHIDASSDPDKVFDLVKVPFQQIKIDEN
jgi:UMP-CMP kinase